MLNGEWTLMIDQYGGQLWARTLKELQKLAGPGKVSKVYRDKDDGTHYHVGYCVGKRWFDAYKPVRIEL